MSMKHNFGLQKGQEEHTKRQHMPYSKERSSPGLLRSAFRCHFGQHLTTLCSIAKKVIQTRVRDNTATSGFDRPCCEHDTLSHSEGAKLWRGVDREYVRTPLGSWPQETVRCQGPHMTHITSVTAGSCDLILWTGSKAGATKGVRYAFQARAAISLAINLQA